MDIVLELAKGLIFGVGFGFSCILILIIFDRYISWKNERDKAEYLKEKRKKKQQNARQKNS